MQLIESDIIRINFIVEQYQEKTVKNSLEKALETIQDILKNAIDSLASSYQLTEKTQLKDLKFYSFTSRIKKGESLREKLVRNNLVNNFRTLLPDNFDQEETTIKKKVRKKIKEIDDIIGIRILTDLSIDCFNISRLLNSKEFKDKVAEDNLYLNEEDLVNQPKKMKNGLEIFKIKGIYDESTPFELQIKSKIIAAWGDMEHSIFYKDYATSPIKDTNQVAMNHVGKLLFQVDDFLFSIRKANKAYIEKVELIDFYQEFGAAYKPTVSSLLSGIDYDFGKIIEILYWLKHSQNIKIHKIKNKPLRTSHLSFQAPQHPKYISLRNNYYDLKLLEAISLSWILDEETLIDSTNIDNHLSSYFDRLVEALTKMLFSKKIFKDEEHEVMNDMKDLVKLGFDYDCDCKFIFDISTITRYFKIKLLIKDLCLTEDNNDSVKDIQNILYLILFRGNTNLFKEKILKGRECLRILNLLSSNLDVFRENKIDDMNLLVEKITNSIKQ